MIQRKMNAAAAYIERGWKIFVVSAEKRPLRNCAKCAIATQEHDAATCPCLTCHAFYAATDDVNRIRAMLWTVDGGMLALATGKISGVVAIDAEGDDKDGFGETGLEVLDAFDTWSGGTCLTDTLRSATTGGGVHLLYQYPGTGAVQSRNRVLPNVDVKADGGYVVLPPGGNRSWLNWSAWSDRLEVPDDALKAWMTTASAVAKHGQGSILSSFRRAETVPAGHRYEFTRDLVYFLRKQGYAWDDAVRVCEGYWARYEQPPGGAKVSGGVWFLPFKQVMYELERVWKRVEPEKALSFQQMSWVRKQDG